MASSNMSRAHALFSALCELPRDEQEAALKAQCPDDPEVAAMVRRLLERDRLFEEEDEEDIPQAFTDVLTAALDNAPKQIGAFQLDALIAQGGMGQVWRGHHLRSGVPVAIKMMRPHLSIDEVQHHLFRAEIRSIARLRHPGIVAVYEQGVLREDEQSMLRAQGEAYLIMEWVEGGTLRDHLGQMAWPVMRAVLFQILEALGHAHARRLIHRDIKPGNILIDGALPKVRLADFGIAHILSDEGDSVTDGMLTGTPSYMAPEQIRRAERWYGPSTDLYAVGCLGWAMVCGAPPFIGDNAVIMKRKLASPLPPFVPMQAVPEGVEDWLRRLMHREPLRRFGYAAEAARALRALETDQANARPLHPSGWGDRDGLSGWRMLPDVGLGLVSLQDVPLVGREAERDALWRRLAESRADGRPRVVVLRGLSGMGKRRLARWMGEYAEEVGAAAHLWAPHAPQLGHRMGITAMIARHFNCLDASAEVIREHVEATLRVQSQPQAPQEADVLAAIIAASSPGARRTVDAQTRRTMTRRLLQRLGRQRPSVVRLEDVQWGSEALMLAQDLLSAMECPALILLTVQDEALTDRPEENELLQSLYEHSRVTVMEVGPLPPAAHRRLIGEVLGASPALVATVEAHTAGDPQYTIQLLQDWAARGQLESAPEGFRLAGADAISLPADRTAIWRPRLEEILRRCTTAERRALEFAAVLGVAFEEEEWRAVCADAGSTLPFTLIESLSQWQLLRREEHGWRFSRAAIAEAVLEGSAQRRREHHRRCAQVLQQRGAPPERVGLHLWQARAFEKALAPLRKALNESPIDRYEAKRVRVLLEDCLEKLALPPTDTRWLFARLVEGSELSLNGQYEEAISVLEQQISLSVEAGAALYEMTGWDMLAHAWSNAGQVDEAVRVARLARDRCEAIGKQNPWIWTNLYHTLALTSRRAAALEDALRWAEQAAAFAEGAELLGESLRERATCLMYLQRWAPARAAILRAMAVDGEDADWGRQSRSWNILGSIAVGEGHITEAKDCFQRALRLAEISQPAIAQTARANLALIGLRRGDFVQVEQQLRPLWLQIRQHPTMLGLLVGTALLSVAAHHQRWEEWDALFDEIERFLQTVTAWEPDMPGTLRLAWQTTLEAGAVERAARVFALELGYWTRFKRGGVKPIFPGEVDTISD